MLPMLMLPEPLTPMEPPCAVPEKPAVTLLPVSVAATAALNVALVEPAPTVAEAGDRVTPGDEDGVITTAPLNPVERFTVTVTVLLPPGKVLVPDTPSENPATGVMFTAEFCVIVPEVPVNVRTPEPVAVTVYCPELPGLIVAGPLAVATELDDAIVTGAVNVPTGVTVTVTQLAQAPPPSKKVPFKVAVMLNDPLTVMVTGTWIAWLRVPLVPVTVNDCDPPVAVNKAETSKVTDPLPLVVALPTTAALIPVGNPLALKAIGILAAPPVCVTVMVTFPELFWASDNELDTARLKSAAARSLKHTLTEVE
jgi:hypothetical protein